jgi:hypothetical protein
MNICTFAEPVTVGFKKSAGGATSVLEPMRPYVISRQQLDRIIKDQAVEQRLYKCSTLEPRLKPFTPSMKRANGTNRLLFYNGSGGYGDAILSWPVTKWLAEQGFEVHVLSDPGNQSCWYCLPWVKSIMTVPLPYDTWRLFDHHFVMEHVSNLDEHQDQIHPIDAMFTKMGVEPDSVAPSAKVVHPIFTWNEQQLASMDMPNRTKLGFFQLSSANPLRAALPNDSAFLLSRIAEAYPDTHWLALYDEFIPKPYVEALHCKTCSGTGKISSQQVLGFGTNVAGTVQSGPQDTECPDCKGWKWLAPNIEPYAAPVLRNLWALVWRRASVCVSPDSMLVHVAGSMHIPCVGLWGPVGPPNRVKYYRNHLAVFHQDACPHAPCFGYLASFPKYCPPRGAGPRTVCEVMAAITPGEVVDAIGRIRR